MALQYSPRIVTDNLAMCLDASQNKSFPSTTLPVKSGLVMWMDAADDTTFSYSSGTTVSQWRDKSVSGFHMTPKSGGPTRSTTLNSRKVLTFTTSQTIGNNTINLSTSANTVFVVSRLTGTTNGRVLTCNLDASGNNWLLGHHGGTSNAYYAEGWVYDSAGASTSFQIYMGDWSGTSTDLANFYINGTAYATNNTAASQGPKYLGINYYSIQTSTCEAAEIIVFDRVLTGKERKLIHTYLGLKWGILNTDRNWHDLVSTNDSPLGNGTTANMPRFDYYNGGSLAFDGINDYVNLNSGAAITGFNPDGSGAGRSRTSVNLWFKPITTDTANTNKMIFSDNCSPEFSLHQYNNTVLAYAYAGVSATIEANKWYNACWVSDAGAASSATTTYITFYLNGELVGSTSTSTGNGLNDNEFNLGRDACTAGTYFSGSIGIVQLYSRDLTATEVKQLYQAHRPRYFQTIVQGGFTLNVDAGNPYSYAGAGFDWVDVSGNSYICTLINGPTYSNGAIVFDGTNDYVDLTYPYSVSIAASGNAARSMFVWIKTTYTGNQAFISTGTAANSQSFNLVKYGSYVGVMGYNNDYYPSSGAAGVTLTDNVWHYIGVTFDGTNLRTYVDGVLDNTSGTLTYSTTGQNNFIGKSSHTGNENYTNGSMGLVHIYNRALSGAEVLQNYNATKGRFGR
jgi:hypothetical protein